MTTQPACWRIGTRGRRTQKEGETRKHIGGPVHNRRTLWTCKWAPIARCTETLIFLNFALVALCCLNVFAALVSEAMGDLGPSAVSCTVGRIWWALLRSGANPTCISLRDSLLALVIVYTLQHILNDDCGQCHSSRIPRTRNPPREPREGDIRTKPATWIGFSVVKSDIMRSTDRIGLSEGQLPHYIMALLRFQELLPLVSALESHC
ncbi:hypothetical protein C8R47DRAFT_69771 [Mycena vitilis]|nr:hypothetical protein C8R47DRAFT_69771 [Mycena vitilis]